MFWNLQAAIMPHLVLLNDALHILLGCINDGTDLGTSCHISNGVTNANGHAVLHRQNDTHAAR
jgi:hypothetical protein